MIENFLTFTIFSELWKSQGRIVDFIKVKSLVLQASSKYVENYINRHGIIKILGMSQPISLENIYISTLFVNNSSRKTFEIIDDISFQNKVKQRFSEYSIPDKNRTTVSGIDAANENQYLMVLGQPGSGKSTYLRRIGLEALKGKEWKHKTIPVFVELKRFLNKPISIEELIEEEFQICGFPKPHNLVYETLKNGKLLVLLDGLDEVPNNKVSVVINKIQDFVDKYSTNRFIVSCRTEAYRYNFRRFTDFEIAYFDKEQISSFVQKWYSDDLSRKSKKAQVLLKKLEDPIFTPVKEFSHTPLLLAFLCLVFESTNELALNIGSWNAKIVDILLNEWNSEKQVVYSEIPSQLHFGLIKKLLSYIAFSSFSKGNYTFTEKSIVDWCTNYLKNIDSSFKKIDMESLLFSLRIQNGIIIKRAFDIYSFSYLSLQEYLTAFYISENTDLISVILDKYLSDESWNNIFIILSDILDINTYDLSSQIIEKSKKYINTPNLSKILIWSINITVGLDGELIQIVNQVDGIALALFVSQVLDSSQSLYRAIDYALTFSDRLKDLMFPKDKTSYPEISQLSTISYLNKFINTSDSLEAIVPRESIIRRFEKIDEKSFFSNDRFDTLINEVETNITNSNKELDYINRDSLRRKWFDAFHTDLDIFCLSEQEVNSLSLYLQAQLLALKCRESSIFLKNYDWGDYDKQMLKIDENILRLSENNHEKKLSKNDNQYLLRIPEIYCPEIAVLHRNIDILVRLLSIDNELKDSIHVEDNIAKDLPPVQAVLRAQKFNVEGSIVKNIKIEANRNSETDFSLESTVIGNQEIQIDFYQHDQLVGTVLKSILVLEVPAL